jgi:tRNA threonylcarbamoyladenosine biosynthesis protein TsaB
LAIILNIETATKNCSVSLSENDKILNCIELNEGQFSHAEKLHDFIVDVLKLSNLEMENIKAVAVSKGPGSYTGLRIGISAAKGLCFALGLPLISVPTLSSLANSIEIKEGEYIIPLIDARRMEVYSSVFDNNYMQIRETSAEIIDKNSFSEFLKKGKVYFLGDGAAKCKEIIHHENAVFTDNKFPSANEMAKLSYEKFISNDFEDVAYFEPYYLKDFIAGKPKKYFN